MKRTLIALTFSATLVLAQTPPSADQIAAQRVARLTTLLTLNSAQQYSATTIFTSEATAVSTLRTADETLHTLLETSVESNDAAGIANAANQLGALSAREVQARASADAAFYALLTADQQAKYKELQASRGPGGPGGPGRGPGAAGFARLGR
jgi:Spy/CpxP family protein refolding chaperone